MTDQTPAPSETHPYNRACRNTQHSGCTCMHPVNGQWCGKERHDPVHTAPSDASDSEQRIADEDDLCGMLPHEILAEIKRLTIERDEWKLRALEMAGIEDTAIHQTQRAEEAERELSAISEAVGAQPDETTLQAVQDMMVEHRHYVRETNRAHEETIPRLTAERDEALGALAASQERGARLALIAAHLRNFHGCRRYARAAVTLDAAPASSDQEGGGDVQ